MNAGKGKKVARFVRSESKAKALVEAAQKLHRILHRIDFSSAVPWVYDPLDYAWESHCEYLYRYVGETTKVLFLGMNPGPWGMVQTGVPFGEVAAVRDWLALRQSAKKPAFEHPKRPIEGLACSKSEVSGRRLWGYFRSQFQTPDAFFSEHFVANYCPLAFMSETAANVTPDKLPSLLRKKLEVACDAHLETMVELLSPEWAIGIGGFAEECLSRVCSKFDQIRIGRILHPSPASPAANRDWEGTVSKQLSALGIWGSSHR